MKVDAAILRVLGLDASSDATISSAGGGGMSSASTAKITATRSSSDNKKAQVQFFLKTGHGPAAATMFEGEHASLNAVHRACATLCPRSLGWGKLADAGSSSGGDKFFLVTEFLDLSGSRRSGGSGTSSRPKMSLADKMARLHTTPAPAPEGHGGPMFGFPATTCCGDTPQENSPYRSSWAEFFAENRLRFILRQSERRHGPDQELAQLVSATIDAVVPRLIGDEHLNGGQRVLPVVVHGDLWSGNAGKGRILSSEPEPDPKSAMDEPEDVVYDPSACYAHSEYDLGIMNMFGGFGRAFFDEYHRLCPKTEPVAEYEDRVALYELYHHLNHHALFGGGYRGGAVSIMKRLLRKYGGSSGGDADKL